ncbi:MAG TPA: BamA/TamA family outer membrane protein [Candidatus Krumholzibacteria bacterium]|nr:BamA/TamA family outer membrane protein [Candidatus Krumholzibacteria bacterium]
MAGLSPASSSATVQRFESEAYQWAQGRMIDTVYVHGNTRVKSFAVVREMESRQGNRLEARSVERDQRYISDLSPFATVAVHVEPIAADRCIIHVVVTERPTLLLNLIYPVLDYDINTERIVYGLKWKDRNFRRRLENFSLDALRDNRNNDSAAAAWSTAWLGWNHIGLGARVSYFNRQEPAIEPNIIEQTRGQVSTSVPLTRSRIAFSQLIFGLALAHNRVGARNTDKVDEDLLSPSIGFRFDNRDASLKPRNGSYFYINLLSNQVLNASQDTYYRVDNDVRFFFPLDRTTVVGLNSVANIQLGEYPSYIRFGIGGPGTIRGYERSDFRAAHRWVQSLEVRMMPWPKVLYRIPFIGITDFQLGVVAFVDTGIAWTTPEEFRYDNFHSGFGVGVRLFSPIQDVVRLDLAYGARGRIRPYFSTGANF